MLPIQCGENFNLAACVQASVELEYVGDVFEDVVPYPTTSGHACATSDFWPQPATSNPALKRPLDSQGASKGENARQHKKRQRLRAAKIAEHGHVPRAKIIASHVQGAPPIAAQVETKNLPASSCGYTALQPPDAVSFFMTVQEALDAGYRLIEWDGV